jgi:hypothetical protein
MNSRPVVAGPIDETGAKRRASERKRMTHMQIKTLTEALRPLAAIADAYDADELDEARPSWGGTDTPEHVELFQGRGGRQLLTLADAFAAREALRTGQGLFEAIQPFVKISRAYDANELDDGARKFWGYRLQHRNNEPLDQIEIFTGRGGRRLLTLADATWGHAAYLQAREDASHAA